MIEFLKRVRWSALWAALFVAALGWLLVQMTLGAEGIQPRLTQVRPLQPAEVVLILLGTVAGYMLLLLRPLVAVFSGLAFIAIFVFASHAAAPKQTIWFGWVVLFIQIAAALVLSVTISAIRLRRANNQLARALETNFSPATARRLTALRYRSLFEPGIEWRKLTILFAEIPEFTADRGQGSHHSTAVASNDLTRFRECIHTTAGVVAQAEQGKLFAFWNAPESQVDHSMRAAKSALRLRKRFTVRIGLHTGVASVGNFGSISRIEYRAEGQTVDLAARLAALNNLLGTQVLITSEMKWGLSESFVTRYLGNFRFAGFEDSVSVYEIVGGDEVDETGRSLRDCFEQAVYSFQGSDLQDAESSFRRVLDSFPADPATLFYLRRIEAMAGEPLPYDWNGTVEVSAT
ncbi:MAG TPA: adenylate/guanylate cyclase domain-containing protein [Candidatus Acidoferrum sp.]|nr:adenylate/guanylate cyclase domain-containing protein [Candidatus Acidoferrum sp.]